MESGQFDILILDEINNALHLRLVDLEQVLEIIRKKPPSCILFSRAGMPTLKSLNWQIR